MVFLENKGDRPLGTGRLGTGKGRVNVPGHRRTFLLALSGLSSFYIRGIIGGIPPLQGDIILQEH